MKGSQINPSQKLSNCRKQRDVWFSLQIYLFFPTLSPQFFPHYWSGFPTFLSDRPQFQRLAVVVVFVKAIWEEKSVSALRAGMMTDTLSGLHFHLWRRDLMWLIRYFVVFLKLPIWSRWYCYVESASQQQCTRSTLRDKNSVCYLFLSWEISVTWKCQDFLCVVRWEYFLIPYLWFYLADWGDESVCVEELWFSARC